MDAHNPLQQYSQHHEGFIRIYGSYEMEDILYACSTDYHQYDAFRGSGMQADDLEDWSGPRLG